MAPFGSIFSSEVEMFGLNIAERAGLEVAMIEVAENERVDLEFWGKINGQENDYLIAATTLTSKRFPSKKFYYTTSTKPEKLSQMPEVSEEHQKVATDFISKPFTGDPSFLYIQEDETFREEHRLAHNVACIDAHACVVPCGAFLVNASRSVVKNENFKGLSSELSASLSSFFHLRPPTSEYAQKALEKPAGLVRPADFLDKLTDDTPSGIWTLNLDASGQIVSLRSLYFIGATFYHAVATPHYRNIYNGDGTPNLDLPFML